MSQHQVNKPKEQIKMQHNISIFKQEWKSSPVLKLYDALIPGYSLSDGIDGKLLSHTAIGPCTPWHSVIFQPPPSFIKIFPHWSILIQEAIIFEFLERKHIFRQQIWDAHILKWIQNY